MKTISTTGGGGGTPYNSLYGGGEAPAKRGTYLLSGFSR